MFIAYAVGVYRYCNHFCICIFVICVVVSDGLFTRDKVLTHYMNHFPPALFRVGWVCGRRGWKEQQCAGDGCQAQELCRKIQNTLRTLFWITIRMFSVFSRAWVGAYKRSLRWNHQLSVVFKNVSLWKIYHDFTTKLIIVYWSLW